MTVVTVVTGLWNTAFAARTQEGAQSLTLQEKWAQAKSRTSFRMTSGSRGLHIAVSDVNGRSKRQIGPQNFSEGILESHQ